MRGTVPFATVNAVFWAGIALGLAVYAVWLWRARAAAPALCEAALLYYFTVFFFTQRMRERYLLPALVLAALCALCTRRRGYALLACGLAATTLSQPVFGAALRARRAWLSFPAGAGAKPSRLGAVADLALWCAAAALVLWPAVRRTWQAARVRRTSGRLKKSGEKRGNSTLFLLYCISVEVVAAGHAAPDARGFAGPPGGRNGLNEMVLVWRELLAASITS